MSLELVRKIQKIGQLNLPALAKEAIKQELIRKENNESQ